MDDSMSDCLCGHCYDSEQFMIECDVCKKWYHGVCVSVKEYMSTDLDKYHCPRCEPTSGPSQPKARLNWHRHDYTEPDADSKPVQTGTAIFIKELKSRHFSDSSEVVKSLRGQQLTLEYLQANGFESPIIIQERDGLDMTIPAAGNFSVYDVESYIGGDREMDVIDVASQRNIRMKLRDFVEYYQSPARSRVFNVISLEFTNTRLSPLVEAPLIARQLDWVNTTWPRDLPEEETGLKRPEIQKYCLMSVQDSFTDFHIDFGGTSVWYHVLEGEKIFYLIKPSPGNLQLYQQWMSSSSQSETFFGDQVDACYKCIIKAGQTMMIPTGWIHAVLTPLDSIVFGGNFVHSLNIPMQIQIYELERKMKTPTKFQYPGFETINWFAARKLLLEIKQLNADQKKCPQYLLQGLKALLIVLKQWNTDKDYHTVSRGQIPNTLNSTKLLKELSKEIRQAERFLMTFNPPKPERESKRKKKKPVNKGDFVDFKLADRILIGASNPAPPLKTCLKLTIPKIINSVKAGGGGGGDVNKIKKLAKQSPTVIRFKLGDNEIVRSTNENLSIVPSMEKRKDLGRKQSSIYDFHDGSNDSGGGFVIDEAPKRKKSKNGGHKKSKKSNNNNNDIAAKNDLPKNGIEELLIASAYTTLGPTGNRMETGATIVSQSPIGGDGSGGGASPSTREALEGMLSFSEHCYSTETGNVKKLQQEDNHDEDEDDQSIENIDKVHQDEDFIYPALDASDDDEYIFKPRGKRRVDESWNPKARVGPLLPKVNRPAREGVKKTCVEKGLEAAAAKRAKNPAGTKRAYRKQKKDNSLVLKSAIPIEHHQNNNVAQDLSLLSPSTASSLPSAAAAAAAAIVEPTSGYTSILTSPNRLKDVKAKLAAPVPIERKPRKGMKTAKQRLGKILKLHKMMH